MEKRNKKKEQARSMACAEPKKNAAMGVHIARVPSVHVQEQRSDRGMELVAKDLINRCGGGVWYLLLLSLLLLLLLVMVFSSPLWLVLLPLRKEDDGDALRGCDDGCRCWNMDLIMSNECVRMGARRDGRTRTQDWIVLGGNRGHTRHCSTGWEEEKMEGKYTGVIGTEKQRWEEKEERGRKVETILLSEHRSFLSRSARSFCWILPQRK